MKCISTALAAAVAFAGLTLAGPLNITEPAGRVSYPPQGLPITWDIGLAWDPVTGKNITLEDLLNVTIALWYFPYNRPTAPDVQASYLVDILGVVPATQKSVVVNLPTDIGPSGRNYKIYINATPANQGYSQSGLFALTDLTGTNATAMAKGSNIDGYSAANAVNPPSAASTAHTTLAIAGSAFALVLAAVVIVGA